MLTHSYKLMKLGLSQYNDVAFERPPVGAMASGHRIRCLPWDGWETEALAANLAYFHMWHLTFFSHLDIILSTSADPCSQPEVSGYFSNEEIKLQRNHYNS